MAINYGRVVKISAADIGLGPAIEAALGVEPREAACQGCAGPLSRIAPVKPCSDGAERCGPCAYEFETVTKNTRRAEVEAHCDCGGRAAKSTHSSWCGSGLELKGGCGQVVVYGGESLRCENDKGHAGPHACGHMEWAEHPSNCAGCPYCSPTVYVLDQIGAILGDLSKQVTDRGLSIGFVGDRQKQSKRGNA